VVNKIFDGCVRFLEWLARKTGLSYKEVNVWIFCVAVPLVVLGQAGVIAWLLLR
jgi:hypothetical protein